MIVQCPGCLKRYRITDARSRLLRVRCKSCGQEFLVAPSQEAAHEIKGNGGGIKAVLADIQRDFRTQLVGTLTKQKLHLFVVEDGEEAFKVVAKEKPRLLLVNPYLPKLMGIELITRLSNEGLRPETVVLLGAIHNPRRYTRLPESLYGADDYIDEGWSEGAILHKLTYHLHFPLHETERGDEAGEGAARLARIVLTDILVYESARMAEVKRVEDFFSLFADEAAEGRRYIEERYPGKGNLLRQVVADYLRQR
ncbi:MAG: hypothetical protein JHC34_05875 [Acidobacteria bacterium]|nr:hypothetical protein [Acidobacteriota bacterium]